MKSKKLKAQSILEYLIVLAAIVAAIIAGTTGLHRGMSNKLNDITQDGLETNLVEAEQAPENVQENDYYVDPSEPVFDGGEYTTEVFVGTGGRGNKL